MDMHRRAMESLGEVDETAARDKLEWTTSNRVVVDLAALRLRDFSVAQEGRHPALVVTPFALHDAALADLAPRTQPRRDIARQRLLASLPR
jgi:hypothetical protein